MIPPTLNDVYAARRRLAPHLPPTPLVRHPLLDADLDDDARAARLVDAFRTLLPATGTLVSQHFRRVLLRVAQEHLEAVGDADERAAADAAAARRIEETRS